MSTNLVSPFPNELVTREVKLLSIPGKKLTSFVEEISIIPSGFFSAELIFSVIVNNYVMIILDILLN